MPPILRVSLDERGAGGRVKEQQQWEQQYATWGSEQGGGAGQGGQAAGMEAADENSGPEQPSPLLLQRLQQQRDLPVVSRCSFFEFSVTAFSCPWHRAARASREGSGAQMEGSFVAQ